MEPTAKSANTLRVLVISILLIPILWSVGHKLYNNNLFVNNQYTYYFLIKTTITCTFIFMIYKRMYGILLFMIVNALVNFLDIISHRVYYPNSTSILTYAFDILLSLNIVLMTVLLFKENKRLFNLEFNLKQQGFKKTYRLITAYNFVFNSLFLISVGLLSGLVIPDFSPSLIVNAETILWLISVIMSIIGIATKSKFQILAFAISLALTMNVFQTNFQLIVSPFTLDWRNNFDRPFIAIGIAASVLLIASGILLFYILQNYMQEKRQLTDNNAHLESETLLDA